MYLTSFEYQENASNVKNSY